MTAMDERAHALLSPSSSHRWLNCAAAPRLERRIDGEWVTPFAEEGTLAHAIAARKLYRALDLPDTAEEEGEIAALMGHHSPEMEEHTDAYRDLVMGRYAAALERTPDARLLVERRLDFSRWVPEAFGTSDATIVADGLMEVIDLKYGRGVKVNAESNSQMMIYALGALDGCGADYAVDRVKLTIVQPRLGHLSEWEVTVADLLSWAERTLRPKALAAYAGAADPRPGEWCRFCRARSLCRAEAKEMLSLAPAAPMSAALLTAEEVAALLPRLAELRTWVSAMEIRALDLAISGAPLPGYKLVRARGRRVISDERGLAEALRRAGFCVDDYAPRELMGVSELERLVGRRRFAEISEPYVTTPEGRPTLVSWDDPRPPITVGSEFDDIDLSGEG